MAKRQKRIDPVNFSGELPNLMGKKVNLIDKNGAAYWVSLQQLQDEHLVFYSMRNNASKKDRFRMPLTDIAEIIIDYPDVHHMDNSGET